LPRTKKNIPISESELIARKAAEAMLEKKAKNVVLMNVMQQTDITDYFVICSAESDTQVKAIASNVLDNLAELGEKPFKTEGWSAGQWVILDFYNFVAHVFYQEARDFYRLEKLWSDADIEEIQDTKKPARKSTKKVVAKEATAKETPVKKATAKEEVEE